MDPPPAPTPEILASECIARRSRQLARAVTRHYDDALRPYGIRATQLNLLAAIALRGPVRAGELGAALDLEQSTVSRNLARMAANGWIRAGEDADDARARPVEITGAGRRLMERAAAGWSAAQERARDRLGGDVVAVLDDLTRAFRGP